MREAVLTVSPNKQYRGIVMPTTPATTGPAKYTIPISIKLVALIQYRRDFPKVSVHLIVLFDQTINMASSV